MGRSKRKYYAKSAGEISSFDGYVTIADTPDTLRIPDSIPLTNGVGGEIIGDAQIRIEGGVMSVAGNITNTEMLQKLSMPAGSFSMVVSPPKTKLCEPCANDLCDSLLDSWHHFCRCCSDGHVV